MLKKSASSASADASVAAEGVSIITPNGIAGLNDCPSPASSEFSVFTIALIACNSSRPRTIGKRSETGCAELNRSMARSWLRRISGPESRIDFRWQWIIGESFVTADVEEANHHAFGPQLLGSCSVETILFGLGREMILCKENKLGAI